MTDRTRLFFQPLLPKRHHQSTSLSLEKRHIPNNMISGTFLRVLTTSGTATGNIGKKIISQPFVVGRNACKEEFFLLQTASYHKTAIRREDVPEGKEMDTNIVTKTKIAEVLAHDFDISKSKAERIVGKIFNEISQVSSCVPKRVWYLFVFHRVLLVCRMM